MDTKPHLIDRVSRLLARARSDELLVPFNRTYRATLALERALGLSRATVWRYRHQEPDWFVFALLGAALTDGDDTKAKLMLWDLLAEAEKRGQL